MKTIALKTVSPTYGLDNKFTGFQSELDARYPFNDNGLVMAIAKAKAIFAQGYARGLELVFSYSETDERKMPMADLFSLIDLSPRDLARYASMEIRDEETRRIDEGRTAMLSAVVGWVLAKFPQYLVTIGDVFGSRDIKEIVKAFSDADFEEYEGIVPIFFGTSADGIMASVSLRDGSGDSELGIFECWTTNLNPAIKLANEIKAAYEPAEIKAAA